MISFAPSSYGGLARRRTRHPIADDALILVSDEDADLARLRWRIMWAGPTTGYIPYPVRDVRPRGTIEYLARVVAARIGLSPDRLVRCRDGNRLNCQRDNIMALDWAARLRETA